MGVEAMHDYWGAILKESQIIIIIFKDLLWLYTSRSLKRMDSLFDTFY